MRAYRPGDDEALLALHNRAFNGHSPRSRRHWNWKFRENPVGDVEIVVAMDADGRALAVYGVVPQRCVLRGEECAGSMATDLAVDPGHRSGLGGGRLILAIGQHYARAFAAGRKSVEWGFPEPQLQRVCLTHFEGGVLRDVSVLVREPRPPLHWRADSLEVHSVRRFGADVDALWKSVVHELGVATIRDARYLNWRYVQHPDVPYVLLEAREAVRGTLRGVAVLRSGGLDASVLSLMDWLVPYEDREAEHALLSRALEETARRAKSYLVAWFPLSQPHALRWQREHGFFARITPFQESYRCWVSGLDRRWLEEHWYQTLGDIDFL